MDASNPYAPPRADVRDVIDPQVALQHADRGVRLAAAILDAIILGVMVYGPLLAGLIVSGGPGGFEGGFDETIVGPAVAVAVCAGFIVWSALTIRFVSRNGQSIGKRLLGIKVVRADGSRASLGRIFWLRNVVNGLFSIVPFYSIVDWLFIFGESRQCLHDKLADTIVVQA